MFGQQTNAQPTTAEARVKELIASLLANDDILETEVDHMHEGGEIAEFNQHGPGQPKATATKKYAGTTGVNACVAVLVRAKRNGTLGLGSVHLSAIDMGSAQTVDTALTNLWNALVQALNGAPDAGTCDIFAVGGADSESLSWSELERVLAGCQRLAQQRQARLAGALMPVNDDDTSVEVYIEEDGVGWAFEGSDSDS